MAVYGVQPGMLKESDQYVLQLLSILVYTAWTSESVQYVETD